jgi:tRNA(Phe) wybutosine-synthesizing methylase Tyw3
LPLILAPTSVRTLSLQVFTPNKGASMIEVQLSKQDQEQLIVTFDANVLNYYSVMNVRTTSSASGRIHVGHIQSIEITTNNKGKPVLVVMTKFGVRFSRDEVEAQAVDKVRALVADVQRAMQTVKL